MNIREVIEQGKRDKAALEAHALRSAVAAIRDLPDDSEGAHGMADEILCEYLRKIGAAELASAFDDANERIEFWYA